jgi:uncharacterized protein YjiS (DUF1127 family)
MTDLQAYSTRSSVTGETAAAIYGVVSRAVQTLAARAYNAYVVYRDTRRLGEMSDAELADMGIHRSEIDHAIRYGRRSEY